MEPGQFDLVGFAVGVVERDERLPGDVRPGDRIVGIGSPGLRSNGYSLARKVLLEHAGRGLDDPAWAGAVRSLGDELLVPSVIYSPVLSRLAGAVDVRAFAHVTGGGIPGNLVRVLPAGAGAVVRRGTWEEPRIFAEIQAAGDVPDDEMERVFNLGLGMLVVVAEGDAGRAVAELHAAGHPAWDVGAVVEGSGVTLTPG